MKALPLLLALLAARPLWAGTDIYIGISSGQEVKRTAVAMASFLPARKDSAEDLALADEFREIVRADLLYSRYFDIKEDAMARANLDAGPESLAYWKDRKSVV